LILNAVLAFAVFVVLVGHHVWSIVAQHRDRPHVLGADIAPRRQAPDSPRRQAQPRHEPYRGGRPWPAS
jgi:hypothetical protein